MTVRLRSSRLAASCRFPAEQSSHRVRTRARGAAGVLVTAGKAVMNTTRARETITTGQAAWHADPGTGTARHADPGTGTARHADPGTGTVRRADPGTGTGTARHRN